ncbi:glycosyltransferase family 2 protein [Aequorivita antarctica]|uniref:Glycosyltransferase n=1 Tax=Aequorivita antarctica TaxID=153266 RepID=A0A5C6YXS3_9FLAO|nr:glycosyltransferase family 2 protein [Aequorivita antarctica]TXD72500.1 glycosyltransferase [Aequorivita antarctica]SRX76506.1 PGL/p-HBAD biosynthesis glycosyltransferase [Aequorivita antarctica]
MKNYLTTIVIPTYNCEETIKEALNSILSQSFKNVEILIIDGASTDNTLKILQEYKTQEENLIVHSAKDEGIYDAMNKGIKLAKGDWLYFMGSDDTFYETTTLGKVATLIDGLSCNVIYGNVKIIGNTGWAKEGDIYDGKFDTLKILNKNISHQAIFYKRKFIKEEIGFFNVNYSVCSDWDFNLRCWSKTDFYYTDSIIANFFSGGLSTNGSDKLFEKDFIANILKYFKISLFNSLINSPSFRKYSKVKLLQKEYHPLRTKYNYFMKRLLNKIKR